MDELLGVEPERRRDHLSLAAVQHGVVSGAQLKELGYTADAIRHAVRTQRLHRVHRAVYAVGRPAVDELGRILAAVLAVGPGAVASHHAAAGLWALRVLGAGAIDVTVEARGRARRSGLRVHAVRSLPVEDLTTRRGIPVTTPARTLLDLADVDDDRALEQAVGAALRRRLVRRSDIEQAAAVPGRRGASRLLRLVRGDPAWTRSQLEERLLGLLRAAQLPAPDVNARAVGFEVDFLWHEQRVVVEADGFAFHRSRSAFERDRLRDARLQGAGYRVLRVTDRQLSDEPLAVVARVAGLLRAPGG